MKQISPHFKERRKKLVELANKTYTGKKIFVFVAGFEDEYHQFRQESSFYYLTGIEEPGVVLVIDENGKEILYIPQFADERSQWVVSGINADAASAQVCNVDHIEYLGDSLKGYSLPLLSEEGAYKQLLDLLKNSIEKNEMILSIIPQSPKFNVQQKVVLNRLCGWLPQLHESLRDVSASVNAMRRQKSKREIEDIYKAIELTIVAQEGAACTIKDGKKECEIKAGIDYIFAESCARSAFPSIVASGKNSTILHYTPSTKVMKNGELVVVDIGAEVNYYCGDLTRTYPVSGTFSKRQREIYNVVLETQEYIAQTAAPGFWLNNKNHEDKSLHHLATKFLEKRGYAKYFPHGIGHYLGLDVHDVGSYEEPLQEGDVITIEPGIYIPEENIGIRIEDNYWIVKDGNVCLSQDLPKDIESIEEMAQAALEFDDEEEE